MKLGAENRKVVIAACIMMAFAAFLFVRMLMGWSSASASVPLPKDKGAPSELERALGPNIPGPRIRATQRGRSTTNTGQPTLDPRLTVNLLAQSESVRYEGTGRNIFDRESAPPIPKPVAPPRPGNPDSLTTPPPVYTPPPPPPIPLKFFGFANSQGEPKQVFLSQSDDVFVAREGDVVNRRYKVVKINPNSVEIEDLLTNSRQTIPLTQG